MNFKDGHIFVKCNSSENIMIPLHSIFNVKFEFLLVQTWFFKTSFFESSFGFPNLNLQNLHILAQTYPIKKVCLLCTTPSEVNSFPISRQLAFDFLFVKIMIWLTLFLPLCSDAHNGAFRKILVRYLFQIPLKLKLPRHKWQMLTRDPRLIFSL